MVFLPEIKMNDINKLVIGKLWSDKKVDWVFVPTDGVVGGILIMWDKKIFCYKGVERGLVSLFALFENCGSRED